MKDVTRILSQIDDGDADAANQLLPLVYGELKKLAASNLANENPGQTLQATALVHEAYIRLVGSDSQRCWDSRSHFFGAAAEAMRRILVDSARKKKTIKHGGNLRRVELFDPVVPKEPPANDLLALDKALSKLQRMDPLKAELVKLRYFAGLTIPQAANALGIGVSTADKYWAFAKAWLRTEMANSP